MTSPAFDQDAFRGRNDDGNETGASWIADADIDFSQVVDQSFRLRFVTQETNNKVATNKQYKAQYNKLSAGWVDITTVSSNVKAVGSANTSWTLTDEDATTQQIGGGTFFTGAWNDDNVAGEDNQLDYGGSDETELEFCLEIVSADVAAGNTIQVRVVESDNTELDAYTSTPTITVLKPITKSHVLDAILKSESNSVTHILQAAVGTFKQHKIMASLTKVGGGGSVTLLRGRGWRLSRPPLDVPIGINRESPQADGLTHWWPFIDSRGAVSLHELRSGRHNGGTFNGNPAWEGDPLRGAVLRFDGVNDWIEIDNLIDFGTENLSISVWVKVNSIIDDGGVFYNRSPSGGRPGIFIRTETGGTLSGNFDADATSFSVDFTPTLGQWYHFAMTVDRHGLMSLYIDGVLTTTVDISSESAFDLVNTANPRIGASEGAERFDGWISDVRIYLGTVLSTNRVWQIYTPETRWDLHRPLRPRFVLSPVPAVAIAISTKTHILDTVLKAEGTSATHILDAILKSESNQLTHVLDAVLLKTQTLTHVLDANLKAEGTGVAHVLDAILKKESNQVTHVLDAILKSEANQLTHVLDAVLLKTQTLTHILDAILKAEGASSTHILDAILKSENNQVTHVLDAILKSESNQLTHILQAELSGAVALTHVLDAILKKEGDTKTHILDAILKKENVQLVHVLGAVLLKTQTLTHVLDAILKSEGVQSTHILDAILKSEANQLAHILQAELSEAVATQKTHILDAILKKESNQLAHILDAILKSEGVQSTHTLDAILKKEDSQVAHVLDAILKTEGVQANHVLDAILKSESTQAIHILDATLKSESAQTTHVLDAILKSENNQSTHVLDAILKGESTQLTHVLDAILKAKSTQSVHVLDAVLTLAATITVSHILDAVLVVVSLVSTIELEAELDKDIALTAMLDKDIALLAELDKDDINLEASI